MFLTGDIVWAHDEVKELLSPVAEVIVSIIQKYHC